MDDRAWNYLRRQKDFQIRQSQEFAEISETGTLSRSDYAAALSIGTLDPPMIKANTSTRIRLRGDPTVKGSITFTRRNVACHELSPEVKRAQTFAVDRAMTEVVLPRGIFISCFRSSQLAPEDIAFDQINLDAPLFVV
jgi:hypothetical protein